MDRSYPTYWRIFRAGLALGLCFSAIGLLGQDYTAIVKENGETEITPTAPIPGSQSVIFKSGSGEKSDVGSIHIDQSSYVGGLGSQILLVPGKHEIRVAYPHSQVVLKLQAQVSSEGLAIEAADFESSRCFPLKDGPSAHLAAQKWKDSLSRSYPINAAAILEVPEPPPTSRDCAFNLGFPHYCRLTVRSVPEGADIYINGTRVSTTNTTLKVLDGARLLIRKEGYRDVAKEIDFRGSEETTVGVTMAPYK